MKTILEVISLAAAYLKSRRDAEDLLAASLSLKRIDLYLHFDRPLEEEELNTFREMCKRRVKGEPVAYIIGKLTFYDAEITLSRDVLIPRQETEILVDRIAKILEVEDLEGKKLFDVCTGSGCIAIALKKRFPKLQVFASDLSSKALSIARKNSLLNGVEIFFLEGDLLSPFSGLTCDYFVSNPPYVSKGEFDVLDPQVKNFEPSQALLAGENGGEFYRKIARDIKKILNISAKCWFEIGRDQAEDIKEIFLAEGFEKGIVFKDYSGNDRFFFLERDSFDKVS